MISRSRIFLGGRIFISASCVGTNDPTLACGPRVGGQRLVSSEGTPPALPEDSKSLIVPTMVWRVGLAYGPFPLTPALSLGEREIRTPSRGESGRFPTTRARAMVLPLPKAEGWGEGEGSAGPTQDPRVRLDVWRTSGALWL